MSELWNECLSCQEKCCDSETVFPLFVTENEYEQLISSYPDAVNQFNKSASCPFLKSNKLCVVHEIKPVDCKLFPFDITMKDQKFYWIIREINCPIAKNEEDFEKYLSIFEEKIIPNFIEYMEEYALFRYEELEEKWGYKIIREVRFVVEKISMIQRSIAIL